MAAESNTTRSTAVADHGWFGTQTVKTRLGDFDFRNSYPAGDAARQLREALAFNRAVEAYLVQMHGVSWYRVWKGIADAGAKTPNQVVLWENLMDGATLLLTGNCETVYGLCAIDLKRDGPVVIEAPADAARWHLRPVAARNHGHRSDRSRQGQGRQVPAAATGLRWRRARRIHVGQVADVWCGVRRPRLSVGRWDRSSGLADEDHQNLSAVSGRQSAGDRLHQRLAQGDRHNLLGLRPVLRRSGVADRARAARDDSVARALPARGDRHREGQAVHAGCRRARRCSTMRHDLPSAIARTNSFDSDDPARLVYPDRAWEWAFIGGSATWDSQGYVNTDRRSSFAYIAIGMSPAMVEKHVGTGSQYLWTPRDASGAFLDGGKRYRLHIPPNIPVKNFWSVVAYDADSRSILRSGQPFPSVSTYTGPAANADGSIDIDFGPEAPTGPGTSQELDPDDARQGLVHALPLLRSARTVLRSDLEARRHRRDQVVVLGLDDRHM